MGGTPNQIGYPEREDDVLRDTGTNPEAGPCLSVLTHHSSPRVLNKDNDDPACGEFMGKHQTAIEAGCACRVKPRVRGAAL